MYGALGPYQALAHREKYTLYQGIPVFPSFCPKAEMLLKILVIQFLLENKGLTPLDRTSYFLKIVIEYRDICLIHPIIKHIAESGDHLSVIPAQCIIQICCIPLIILEAALTSNLLAHYCEEKVTSK